MNDSASSKGVIILYYIIYLYIIIIQKSKMIKNERIIDMKKTGIVMADLHFGASNNVEFSKQLESTLFDYISTLSTLDFCIIAGDLFDSIEYLSSQTTRTVIKFITRLINDTEKLKTEIRILEGTRTHDNNQLYTLEDIFNRYMNISRVKFVHTVESETLCDELNVLYIPEQYVVDSDIYYSEYFNHCYDFIFGHGTIDKVSFVKHVKSTMSAPVFKLIDLTSICNHCYFGHIHKNSEYSDGKFKYVGPMTRWEFDKEGPCGFYYIEYDSDNNKFNDKYIENFYAPAFVTKVYNIRKSNDNPNIISIWNSINSDINKIQSQYVSIEYRIRLIVNIDKSVPNISSIKDLITLNVQKFNDIKLVINTIDDTDDFKDTNDNNTIIETYNNCPDTVKIQQFIKNKTGRDRSIDDIKRHLCITED